MKIALANLPWQRNGAWGVRAGSRWPHIKPVQEKCYVPFPFFMAYAAALLRKEGFDVCLIDALAQEIETPNFLKMIEAAKPDLLVAETSAPSLLNDLSILQALPSDIKVAVCGPEASIRQKIFLEKHSYINYVLVGEYEMTLLELVRCLQQGGRLEAVAGMIFRDQEKCVVNAPRVLLEDLDSLPWPSRDGLPMDKYNDAPWAISFPSVQMWSSRGCPYQCLFCAWPQLMYAGNHYRARRVSCVVDEMEHLVNVKDFKSVYFDDDTMNIDRQRMLAFSGEIKRRKLHVAWAMMARADLMDDVVLESLASAGLVAIKYGVESGDQQLLDGIHKHLDLRKVEQVVKQTHSLGIKTHLTFTLGLPGETPETVQRTIEFAQRLNPGSIQFSLTTAFPGTRYYQDLEKLGMVVSRNLDDYDGHSKAMLRTEAMSAFMLEQAKQKAEKLLNKGRTT